MCIILYIYDLLHSDADWLTSYGQVEKLEFGLNCTDKW